MENNFEDRYQRGDIPWDHGRVDFNLVDVVSRYGIVPCNALDIGCGTGDNAIWLSQQGFEVVACDLSATAIERAVDKARKANAECCFLSADFLSNSMPDAPFGFIFDRGCLHSIPETAGRKRFVENVYELLDSGGFWLSLVGNADEPEREVGPPRLSATELVDFVEPCFEIISLTSGPFGSNQDDPPRAWICLMQRR